MRMNAVLSNPKHPEYGQFTVPLPIPHNQYDGIMEALNAMDMGDPLARDCQMDEILGEYPILKRLEGKPVNIDELDYLAKRLDSFCYAQEGAQFQGAAVSYDYSGAYQPMAGDFEESLDYGDIYGRLDALLNLTNQSGYHVQYTENGKMEFRVWDLSVDLQNASFASADSAGNRLIADCEIELEVPVSFGGRLLPPMRMTVKVSAGYTPRF